MSEVQIASQAGHLLCLGMGYTATALARRLAGRGYEVTGTSRSEAGVASLRQAGFGAIPWAGGQPSAALRAAIDSATHVLVSIAPNSDGDPVLASLAGSLGAASDLTWVGYLSTVGVYGDHAGRWVDETTPPAPVSQRSRWRLAAEGAWRRFALQTGKRVEVFRLPGIYGPGRSAIDTLRAGTARRIDKPGQVFNRMHVADIAAALDAALSGPARHALYNLADDEPAPAEAVVAYAAGLLGQEPPPLVPLADAGLSPMGLSFYGESKRVSNARMRQALGLVLRYPTYREGLAAILAGRD